MIIWREHIPYKNTYTNNRSEQALLTVWKPEHDMERAETGNWDDRFAEVHLNDRHRKPRYSFVFII